ncbi:MAG: SusC/RagA family TonB-linked outer membrane protein [Gemmatimonadetes bacterium]|nr:SusC/RagA family TonB-linked outer membrane protein [Gemmatimonadota bacterium]
MSIWMLKQWKGLALSALAVFAVASTAAAQAGTITGKVTDDATGAGLAGARIQVIGRQQFAISNPQGIYQIRSVSAGGYTLRIVMLGYGAQQKAVTVAAGQPTAVDWSLKPVPFQLEQIVVTATGEQFKRELGNTVATIEATQLVNQAQTPDLSTVLNGRIAGVTVIQNDGVAGSGSRIRIRGISSASLSNDPLLYVDGIRVTERGVPLSSYAGGGSPSFLNDINPEDIETIEVVKGPSASTLYGTQAANGVIRITTKRGKAGPAKWNVYTEHGLVEDKNNYLSVWYSKRQGAPGQCFPFQQALRQCTIAGLFSKDILRDPETSPLKAAYRSQYGVQINGGTDAARYFVGAEFEDQRGMFKMPTSEIAFLKTLRGADAVFPANQLEPNSLRKINLRGNLLVALSSKADVAVNTGFVNNDNLIPQTGDNLEGVFATATYGTADPAAASPFGFARPAYGFSNSTYRKSNHFIQSANLNFRPLNWLATRATVGLDYIGYEDQELARNGESCPFCGNGDGVRTLNRFQSYKYSADLGGTATFKLTKRIGSKTSVGGQYGKDNLTASLNLGQVLAPGAETFTGAANKTASELTVRSVTFGTYVEQQFSLDDRLFLTGAVRVDQNSSFGRNSRSATYPKIGGSFVVMEPRDAGLVSSFRMRAAYGASGQQPGALDAIQYYTGTTNAVFGGSAPGVSLGNLASFLAGLGNNNLRPERSKEIEAGFDAGFFRNRITLEATVYRKNTTDALVQRLLPGSLGSVGARTDNVGEVKNEGIEVSISARVLDKSSLQWDVQLELAGNRNRLVALGEGVPPITGFGYQQRPGYPLFGGWWPKIDSYSDANGDGFIDPSEVTVTDTAAFLGATIPARTASLNTNLSLFRGKLRIGGQVEYKGGFKSLEVSTMFQCLFVQNCQYLTDPKTSLFNQARSVGGVFGDWAEDASFVRLKEANVAFTLPSKWARAVGSSNVVATLTGRNLLHYLPNFGGWDSEINTQAGGSGDGPNYNFVQPGQPRFITFRLQLTY